MAAEKGEEVAPTNEREEMEKRIQQRRERIKARAIQLWKNELKNFDLFLSFLIKTL